MKVKVKIKSQKQKSKIHLRVLGYPNPGQSFGRGMCGPEATGVKIDPHGKLSDQSVISMKKVRKVGRYWPPPERHHFGCPRPRCLVFFEVSNFFEEAQNFSKFKIREGRWISVASGRA